MSPTPMTAKTGTDLERAGSDARQDAVSSERLTPARARIILAAILLVACGAAFLATRRTSTTFDEIIMMAAGARGWETGDFDLQPEHPPLMQYVYGLPVHLTQPTYPVEAGPPPKDLTYRYTYAKEFFWHSGNDPERLALFGRIPGIACIALLVLAVYGFTERRFGRPAGLLAAGLVAFVPDVLAHGGVAYNDLPLALAYVGAIWALDTAVRRPSWRTGAVAGVAVAVALSVKFSAIALLPVAALLFGAEAVVRRRDAAWWRAALPALAVAAVASYVALVALYRGDMLLEEFRYGLEFTFRHVERGHGAAGYLLGERSTTGWWYFFPVALLFKTPAALHACGLLAAVGGAMKVAELRRAGRLTTATVLGSKLRAPIVGMLVFGAALLTSNLVIGFRYALPLLPLLCVAIAAGLAVLLARSARLVRGLVFALALAAAGSSLAAYPDFLAYISEYGPGAGRGDEVLLDSSLDWGQGLLALRDYMHEAGIGRVHLSYFGSADPAGYGIDFLPLESFFPLIVNRPRTAADTASVVVISATNLHGLYLSGDPFARFRSLRPDRVLANTLFVYRFE